MGQQRVDRLLAALQHVEHAVRQSGLGQQLGEPDEADGSFSVGLSTKVLPQAIAIGNIHIGTMAGKLNGLIMPTTPSGCRIE